MNYGSLGCTHLNRKISLRRESKHCGIYELHSLISATALQLAPSGLRQSGCCWRSVIHIYRNAKISSNVRFFYLSGYSLSCHNSCSCWRSVIHIRRSAKISSNVPIYYRWAFCIQQAATPIQSHRTTLFLFSES